jgi:hypothetical protein
MTTHYIAFRKFQPRRMTIRVEFAITAETRNEARTIARKEARQLAGYRYIGAN